MTSDIIEKLQWRYACKKFDPNKKLSDQKLQVLKESFDLTATSYGLQPLKMVVIGDQEIKEQLVPLSMNQKQIKDASHVLVICIEREVGPDYIRSYFNRVEEVRQTSRAILDPYEKYILDSFSEKTSEELELWMTKQAYLALGNLLTVCAVEEIDSCPMEGFEPEKYDALLGLESIGLKSVLVLPVGYRHNDDFFSDLKKVRRGIDRVIIDM